MTFEKKKSRLQRLLLVAAALGSCSASFSGVLASLAFQPGAAGEVAETATTA